MVEHPRLASFARYRWDTIRKEHQLVFPEGLLKLNDSGAAIVQLCDGRPLAEMIAELDDKFQACHEDDVRAFLETLSQRGLLEDATGA